MRVLPVGQRACRACVRQFLAGGVDQRAGFAVNAGDRVGSERGDRPEAVQQHVVGHRLHDARHAGHVELERADAELLGVAGNFLDLLFGEDLRMEDRIDVAALVHRLAEGRQVVEIRIFEAAQKNSDRGHAAQDRGARLGLGLALVGQLVADVGVRDRRCRAARSARWHRRFRRRLRQVFADRDDLAAGDADVGLDLADPGNDQRAVAHEQIERPGRSLACAHGCFLASTGQRVCASAAGVRAAVPASSPTARLRGRP